MSSVVLTQNARTVLPTLAASAATRVGVSGGRAGAHFHLLHVDPIFDIVCIQPWTAGGRLVGRDGLVGWNGLVGSDGLVWGDRLVWCHWGDGLMVR